MGKAHLCLSYPSIIKIGDVQKLRLHKGGSGGQLGAILCKLFRLEVYIKREGGGQKSRKYANVVYVRPLIKKEEGSPPWLPFMIRLLQIFPP